MAVDPNQERQEQEAQEAAAREQTEQQQDATRQQQQAAQQTAQRQTQELTEQQLLQQQRDELTAAREAATQGQQMGDMNGAFLNLFMMLVQMIDPKLAQALGLDKIMGFENPEEYQNYYEENLAPGNPPGKWRDNPPPDLDSGKANKIVLSDNFKVGDNPLLDTIAKHESGGDYNIAYGSKHVDFTEMTVDEVLDWQKDYVNDGSPSSAAGRYQIINPTLEGLKKEMGLTGDEMFDETMQDKMAVVLLERRGYSQYMETKEQFDNGEISEADFARAEDKFMLNVSKEWASMPKDGSGRSYYAGDGLNKALTSPEQMRMAMRASGTIDFDTKEPEQTVVASNEAGPVGAEGVPEYLRRVPEPETQESVEAARAEDASSPAAAGADDIPEYLRARGQEPEIVSNGPRGSVASLLDPDGGIDSFKLSEQFEVASNDIQPEPQPEQKPAPEQNPELAANRGQQYNAPAPT